MQVRVNTYSEWYAIKALKKAHGQQANFMGTTGSTNALIEAWYVCVINTYRFPVSKRWFPVPLALSGLLQCLENFYALIFPCFFLGFFTPEAHKILSLGHNVDNR